MSVLMDNEGFISHKDMKTFFHKSITALLLFDELFDWLESHSPFKITSMFRSYEHNKEVGGSSNSNHLNNCAIDFLYPKKWWAWSLERQQTFYENIAYFLEQQSKTYGIHYGFLKYSWGMHIDWGCRTENIEKFM